MSTFSRQDIPVELFERNFFLYPAKRLFRIHWGAFSIRATIRMFFEILRTDIVLIHYCKDIFTNMGMLFAIFLRKETLIQTHGMVDTSNSPAFAKLYFKILFSRAEFILTLTKSEEDHFKQLGLTNLRKIANPINIEPSPHRPKLNEIIYIGRFHERKRPEILIQSMTQICASYPDLILNMYGPDSKYKQEMIDLVKKLGIGKNVKIHPALEREFLPKRLSESKIMILPSYGEIYPLIMLEAAVYGCSMICGPDNGLYQEVKELDFVIAADSVNELSKKILSILSDEKLQSKMINNAFKWVNENCESQQLARQLVSLVKP